MSPDLPGSDPSDGMDEDDLDDDLDADPEPGPPAPRNPFAPLLGVAAACTAGLLALGGIYMATTEPLPAAVAARQSTSPATTGDDRSAASADIDQWTDRAPRGRSVPETSSAPVEPLLAAVASAAPPRTTAAGRVARISSSFAANDVVVTSRAPAPAFRPAPQVAVPPPPAPPPPPTTAPTLTSEPPPPTTEPTLTSEPAVTSEPALTSAPTETASMTP